MDIFDRCSAFEEAKAVREKGRYPCFRPVHDSRGSTVVMDGRVLLMLGSNNHLGLSYDPRVREAALVSRAIPPSNSAAATMGRVGREMGIVA